MLYHIEIDFQTADYVLETRVFKRAHSYVFDHSRVDVRENSNVFHMTDMTRVVRFEAATLASRVSTHGKEDMDSACAELCADSRRIQAIKLVRDTLGYGLKEAKGYVDSRWPYVNPHAPKPEVDLTDIPF